MLDIQSEIKGYLAERPSVGIVLGLLRNDEITDVFSAGTTRLGTATLPDLDSVFRIASMTKSFTAAAVLLLRDQDRIRLDDPVVEYLPHVPRRDITVRDLLTMNAGFPTDDPWGDRHEPTALTDFDAMITAGVSMIRDPRTGFEYSNLSYALLGRIITAVTGRAYTDFVTQELLLPIGMTSTVYDHRVIPDQHRALGYQELATGFVEQPQTLPGAFSPMGGLHSSVRDLSRWVHGLMSAWHGETEHPLSVASRREMQLPHNFARMVVRTEDDGRATASSMSYGYGLIAEEHSALGRFVHHSGGYPGFGSHMRWHPETGLGVIALSNRTYAAPVAVCERVLFERVAAATPLVPVMDRLWPATKDAMRVAEELLEEWNDAVADTWFAHNMDLDVPRAERRGCVLALATSSRREAASITSRSAAHARWTVTGERGTVVVELLMSPDPDPRIQQLTYTAGI